MSGLACLNKGKKRKGGITRINIVYFTDLDNYILYILVNSFKRWKIPNNNINPGTGQLPQTVEEELTQHTLCKSHLPLEVLLAVQTVCVAVAVTVEGISAE